MTGFDQLERQLRARVAERRGAPRKRSLRGLLRMPARRARMLPALAAVVAAASVTIALLIGGATQLSIAARAYAATATTGRVVHYVEVASYSPPAGLGLRKVERRAIVWASGGRTRVIETVTLVSLTGRRTTVHHLTTTGDAAAKQPSSVASAASAALAHALPKAACAASVGCAAGTSTPISALRRLYRQGRLRDAGHTELEGRRLDVIVADAGPPMRILVDPRTFLPVQIVTSYRSAGSGTLLARTTIKDYHRLAPTSQAKSMLAPRCRSSALTAHLGAGGAATGSVGRVVTFTNTSRSTCTLYGYPGMLMLNAGGRPMATHVHRGTSMTVPAVPEQTVALQPRGHASFAVGYADHTGFTGFECPTASRVEITPPNAYHPVTVRWALQPFGGTTPGRGCGDLTVSPVYPGTGRPPTPAPQPAAPAARRCHSSQLAVRLGAGGAATGHVGQVVTFRNTSKRACSLYGYPGMQMIGADGRRLPTHVHRGAPYVVPAMRPQRVLLRPGSDASFQAGYDDGTGYGQMKCPAARTVLITPPNAYRPLRLHWALAPYGGPHHDLHACGLVSVSPVYQGSGSPPGR